MGLNLGPGVSMRLTEQLDLRVELLYSHNGLYSQFDQLHLAALDKIHLHYLEAPLCIALPLFEHITDNGDVSVTSISGGVSYARLLDYRFTSVDGLDVSDEVRSDQESAWLFNAALTTDLSNCMALNAKMTVATFGELTVALRAIYSF